MGGYDYYTPKELADEVMGRLTAGFRAKQEIRSYRLQAQKYHYRLVEKGTAADGTELTLDLVILEPLSGVHYYLLLTTPTAKYKKTAGAWEKVFDSFALTKTEDELYGILKTRAAENKESGDTEKGTQDTAPKDSSPNKPN